MRPILALLAVSLALAIFALSAPATASAAPPPPHCTAATFRPFAAKVWEAPWQRGAPAAATIRAKRRRVACAPPRHRGVMIRTWNRERGRYYARRDHCLSGPVFAGRVSTFGPPAEGAGTTATGVSSAEPGIALYNSPTLGATFRVRIGGRSAYLRQTDIGPAPWTGRTIDVTGAGAARLGGVVTDSWGTAKLIPGDCR